MKRLFFVGALLLPALALAAPTPVIISEQPIAVTGTFTSAGQGNTFGATATLNGNNVCATVWLAGQRGASFDLVPGTLGATLTPSFSADATQVSNGCNAASGNWTTSKFLDPVTGVETATLVVTNPNAGALLNVKIGSASCAKVCTGSSGTTGSTTAFMVATQATATPAPAADTSDRAGRLLGVVYGSQGQQLQQTATNFNLRSELAVGATLIDPRAVRALTSADVVTANAGTGTFAVSAASLPLPTGAATAALQTTLNSLLPAALDGSGFLKTHEQGTATITGTVTANAGSGTMAVSAAALPLPTGAAADTSVNGLLLTQGSTTSGQKGPLHQGAVTTAAPTYTTAQTAPISLQTDGSQRVAVTNTPTVTANAGSGTFAVSAAALPLPTGAAQDTSVTGLQVSQGSTTSGQKGSLQLGAVATSAPTLTNGQSSALSLDTTGSLRVNVTAGGGSNASVGATGSAVPASATLVGGSKSGNTAALVLDASGNLNVNVAAGGAAGGTSSSFGSAFPATGTAVGAKDSTGANLAALNLDASGFLKVNVAAGGGSGGTSSTFGAASPGTGTAAGGFTTTAAPTYVTGNMGALSLTTAGGLREDLSTIAGTAPDTNSGTKSAGTLRVVLATDQPALTNKLLVTPDSVALPANQSVNVSQINGVTTSMGNGVSGTGVQRVTLASDSTGQVAVASLPATPAGANLIGKVGLDQTTVGTTNGVSLAQIGAATVLTGNGTAGTGAQRVTIASDNTAFAVNATVTGAAASGASKSGNPVQQGLVFNTAQPTVTTGQVVEAQATARGAQIVATGADTFNVTVASAPTTAITAAALPLPSGASTETTVAKLTQTQGSTTSGQSGPLLQAAVTTSAPTYTNGQTSPITMDTSGNVRMVWTGTGNLQGLGTAGSPSGGVLTVQPPSSGSPSMPVTAPNGFNAADQNAVGATLSTACTLTTACLNTASIQWPMNGASSSEVTITASSSPLGFTSQVVDASYDATGTTYTNAKCVMVRSDATSTGTVKTALVNADLTSTPSSWEIMCPGAPSWVRFRVAGTTPSGSFNVAGHAVFAPGQARTQGAAIALGAPLNAAGSNIGQAMMAVDSATPTTGRMVRADANGVLVSQATAANLNATVIGGVSNDTSAIAAGAETLPAVARASGTATTAGRAEKLQISSGAGGLFVEGPVANGATAAGNPLGMAGIGRATSAAPTQVTAGQSSALTTDLEHRLWVAAEHPNGSSCIVDAASASTQCVGLSGASLSYYIKSVSFSASAAITFKVNSSTTAGNACATAPALVIPTSYMGANTGGTFTFPQPIKVTANSALCCLPSGASGSCIIAGYIAP